MSTQFYNSFPPYREHASRPVAPSEALSLIQAYLAASASDASLHPNALLTEQGPVSATAGSDIGLVLHNLRRLEAGLRGEHMEADPNLEKFGATKESTTEGPGIGTSRALEDLPEGQFVDGDVGVEGWQSKEDFERKQKIVRGADEGTPAASMMKDVPQVVGTKVGKEVPQVVGTKVGKEVSKEERKKAKKEKRKGEKRERAEERAEERARKKRKVDED